MTDTTHSSSVTAADQLSAVRLQQYLRWAGAPNLVFGVGLGGLYLAVEDTLVLVFALAVGANWIAARRALALAQQDRPGPSVLIYSMGLWTVAATIGFGGLPLFGMTTAVAVLPMIIAVPYVPLASLRLIAFASAGVVAATGLVGIVGWGRPPQSISASTIGVMAATGLLVLVIVIALSVWHAHSTLAKTRAAAERSTARLRASEQELEARVERRSAELTESLAELSRARDSVVAASLHKSEFLANMSHELRTPLNAVIGFSEVLSEEVFGPLNEKQAEYMTDIHESGKGLLGLINDILDVAKIDSGRRELKLDLFEIGELIAQVITSLGDPASEVSVAFATDQPDQSTIPVGVVGDERAMHQVLTNLISNAVKFSPDTGQVQVLVKQTAAANGEPSTVISVTDNGIGISERDLATIFDDFHQLGGGYANKREGAGLGLALARRLVEMHGGSITVTSSIGTGSTFTISLPPMETPPAHRTYPQGRNS